MRRSQRITLRLVPIVAAAFLVDCGRTPRRDCVDQSGRVVADVNCAGQSAGGQSVGGMGTSWDAPQSAPLYRWHSYAPGWFWWGLGNSMFSGGGNRFYSSRSSATTRGGFGATASGHAGTAS